MTGCAEDEFTCDDGQCIDINTRCDQINNCRDKSDEQGCKLLQLDNGYNMEVPPFAVVTIIQISLYLIDDSCEPYFQDDEGQIVPAKVNISTVFDTVIEINEQDHIIELKFEISLNWYELRAKYYNMKINSALNILKKAEVESIWIPYVIFKVWS